MPALTVNTRGTFAAKLWPLPNNMFTSTIPGIANSVKAPSTGRTGATTGASRKGPIRSNEKALSRIMATGKRRRRINEAFAFMC